MKCSNDLKFLFNIVQIASATANRIRYLLLSNEIEKAHELLNVMSNFTLLQPIRQDKTCHENLKLFQALIINLPYSELNELKQIITSAIAKIEAHKDFSL
ncbi:hypothetical protein [Rodentibacter haemolyticus]|uniref:Uncharacterized protein n=1 Tax=Rodentibacter haemolyticus TaxID=2778911 RepID=A0ABX6UYK6_9PAST|nr:hypothetical protein [Rodentibacter haemolyticus]QPB42874.1 hypothetical protein IHV77_01740 [Rodentibacter haemolyticus]